MRLAQKSKLMCSQQADKVDASGVSKGKGFQSTIKRYNASRGPMGHGSKSHRVVGSMGSSAYPSRVKKGKRMPGHMGSANVTIQNLEIVRADAEKNLLLIKGAVPGPKGSVLVIKDSVKGLINFTERRKLTWQMLQY